MEALKNGGNIIGAGGAGGDWESIFENDQSDKVRDPEKMALLWQYSNEVRRTYIVVFVFYPQEPYSFVSNSFWKMMLSIAQVVVLPRKLDTKSSPWTHFKTIVYHEMFK